MVGLTTKEWEYVEKHIDSNIDKLLLSKNSKEYSRSIRQIIGLRIAKNKFPFLLNYKVLYPRKLHLEQSSSQITAQYKAEIISHLKSLRDLSSGFGIDCIFFAKHVPKVYYHEENQDLAEIAIYNFQELNIHNITTTIGNSLERFEELSPTDIIYIDPSRRDKNQNRVVQPQDLSPNIIEIMPKLFQKSRLILVKLSPLLHISAIQATISNIKELHVVSLDNEAKEILLLIEKDYQGPIKYISASLSSSQNHSINIIDQTAYKDAHIIDVSDISKKQYLYEPNTSLMKLSFFAYISQTYNLEKLSDNSHLFFSQEHIQDFPGRVFKIKEIHRYDKTFIKTIHHRIPKANISIRNFPDTVANIRKRTKINDGGDTYMFFSQNHNNDKIVFICSY